MPHTNCLSLKSGNCLIGTIYLSLPFFFISFKITFLSNLAGLRARKTWWNDTSNKNRKLISWSMFPLLRSASLSGVFAKFLRWPFHSNDHGHNQIRLNAFRHFAGIISKCSFKVSRRKLIFDWFIVYNNGLLSNIVNQYGESLLLSDLAYTLY